MSSFVSVGNATQPFPRLLDAVAALAPALPQPVVAQHGATPFAHPGIDARAFMPMAAFETMVASSRLLVLHAGAGSVIHAVRAGKLPVVMPRRMALGEHVDDHQLEFARALAGAGRVVLAETADALAGAVAEALERQDRATSRSDAAPVPLCNMVDDLLRCYAARLVRQGRT